MKPLILNNQEKRLAQECVDVIQQKAALLNKLGLNVDRVFDETRNIGREIICSD
jgi:hypothetical protein